MIKIDTKVQNNFGPMTKAIKAQLNNLPKEAHAEFVKLTPIDTGNARRKTTLKNTTIEANYPYAVRLDRGWSKQAPNGMIEPFLKWFSNRVRQIFGK